MSDPLRGQGRATSRALVVAASEREGLGLVEAWNLKRAADFTLRAGDREPGLGLYRGQRCDLLISGVLEHHMVAGTASALRCASPGHVVNFGACGTYEGRFTELPGPLIGEVVTVAVSSRFDVDDNVHWAPPRHLAPSGLALRAVSCISGSRYSRAADRRSSHFPEGGEVEDMELYGLAVLLETLGLPLYSIKYVTNAVGPSGRAQFRENVVAARAAGERALAALLERLSSEP